MAAAPRSSDVTIFGATGFTGQHVVAEALRVFSPATRLTIAGRDAAKLHALAERLGQPARLTVLGGIDVADVASLQRMAQGTTLLLSAVGPYRLYGEPVFAAAAAAGCCYLDLAGEPEFIEAMQLRYGRLAAQTGALMACGAGFDSIPADLGTVFVQRAFVPPAVPCSVEAVIALQAPLGSRMHFATFEAAVRGIGSVGELRALRREAAAAGLSPKPKLVGPRPKVAEGPTWDARAGAWTLPFPGADASIVRRTQSALSAAGEPAVHFGVRFVVGGLTSLLRFVAYGGLVTGLARWAWGRALLLRWPGLFSAGLVSHEGPTPQQMYATRCTVTLTARGYSLGPPPASDGAAAPPPDKQVVAEVALGDPGYLATSTMLCHAAATLLEEREQVRATVGAAAGGVFTMGTLFRNSSLVERLNGAGVTFQLLPSTTA